MAIKNAKIGGTDYTEQKLTPTNLNDTNDGLLEIFNTEQATMSFMPDTAHLTIVTLDGGNVTDTIHGVELDVTGTDDTARFATASYGPVGYDQNMRLRFFWPIVDIDDNTEVYLAYGFSDNTDAASATKYIGIRITRPAGTPIATAVSKDGATEETTVVTGDFGNMTGTETYRVIDFVLTADASAKIYINGTLVATHSTNFPPNADTTTNVIMLAASADNPGSNGGDTSFGPIEARISM